MAVIRMIEIVREWNHSQTIVRFQLGTFLGKTVWGSERVVPIEHTRVDDVPEILESIFRRWWQERLEVFQVFGIVARLLFDDCCSSE